MCTYFSVDDCPVLFDVQEGEKDVGEFWIEGLDGYKTVKHHQLQVKRRIFPLHSRWTPAYEPCIVIVQLSGFQVHKEKVDHGANCHISLQHIERTLHMWCFNINNSHYKNTDDERTKINVTLMFIRC